MSPTTAADGVDMFCRRLAALGQEESLARKAAKKSASKKTAKRPQKAK
jgi:hypothetical protein